MKIVTDRTTSFSNLKKGDIFESAGLYYIKGYLGSEPVAVDLEDGRVIQHIAPSWTTIPIAEGAFFQNKGTEENE